MSEVRVCENCGDTFTRRRNPGAQPEQLVRFRERRFCSHECSRGNFPGATIDDRFLAKVDKVSSSGGCWLWTGSINNRGYGTFARRYLDMVYAHRWSYERDVGPIPDGLTIDHLCRVTNCVNPEHLEPVTQAENNRRARAAAPPRKPREPRVRVQKRRWAPTRGVCVECGEGRRPVSASVSTFDGEPIGPGAGAIYGAERTETRNKGVGNWRFATERSVTGEACACPEPTAPTRPAIILDPFGGTGTTALVAKALGCHGISNDMSADYCRLAQWRTNDEGELARAMQVDKPAEQVQGQASLLDLLDTEGGAA